jgi:hypothetical protein
MGPKFAFLNGIHYPQTLRGSSKEIGCEQCGLAAFGGKNAARAAPITTSPLQEIPCF